MSHYYFLTPEVLLPFSPLTTQEFHRIRREAGASWKRETRWSDSCLTTYRAAYWRKALDDTTYLNPSSKTRLYNPHLPKVFLVSKLNRMPGYYNSQLKEAAPNKGQSPDLTRFFEDMVHVKHLVAHQTMFGGVSAKPSICRRSNVKMRSCESENLRSGLPKRKTLLNQTQVLKRVNVAGEVPSFRKK
ncbi:uncharacterized protein C4orf51 homolog isoform X1 [Tachyglossus aculeatus]|uniref:uncharacterized protein C4orf51 homolog isoform X1 n=1 Tax=Tachyglossus aculeatus TaxID=9261 RepID=UPI0018F393F6|nr:uncharacterized protein C4orf51 homolog isoform X1 [Tachyglossus aculeatus]